MLLEIVTRRNCFQQKVTQHCQELMEAKFE
jgi:hypothetical protein